MADIVKFTPKDADMPEFVQGETLVKGGEMLFVLAVENGGNCAVLVSMESTWSAATKRKPTFGATPKEMAGWKPMQLGGPRLVQAFDRRTHELVWQTYVPGFVEALHLADEVYQPEPPYLDEGRPIDLVIHTQNHDEDDMLLGLGYWPDGTVPEWWPVK